MRVTREKDELLNIGWMDFVKKPKKSTNFTDAIGTGVKNAMVLVPNAKGKGVMTTMGELYLQTSEKEKYIQNILKDYKYVTKWKCDWDEEPLPRHIKSTHPNPKTP